MPRETEARAGDLFMDRGVFCQKEEEKEPSGCVRANACREIFHNPSEA